MKNPFKTGNEIEEGWTGSRWRRLPSRVIVRNRIKLVDTFTLAQCEAALQVVPLQKRLREAVWRRLLRLDKEGA